jgi:hypothetical protein
MNSRYLQLVFALLSLTCAAIGEESETRSFSIPDHGSIQLEIPKSWQTTISEATNTAPHTIAFIPPGIPKSEVRLSVIWPPTPDDKIPDSEQIRKKVQGYANALQSQSVERELLIRELKGPFASGYYFAATDKAPKPEEYKYLAQGMFRLGGLLGVFTVLTNDGSGAIIDKTITMLKNAACSSDRASLPTVRDDAAGADAIQIDQREDHFFLTVPMSRLILSIPKGNLLYRKTPSTSKAAHPRYFYFEDPALNMIISGWFEPEKNFAGVKKVWEEDTLAWKKNRLPDPVNVSFMKIGNWDTVLYDIESPEYVNSHIRAHWLQADTWIDIHVSITTNKSNQNAKLKPDALLRSFSVTEKL